MAERLIDADGIELCVDAFGDPADPPLLLVMGAGASMLWWEEGFCRLLADGPRFVIRYDQRDTGRSATYPPNQPGYSGADMRTDAVRVLDAHGIQAAHIVGLSGGGGLGQELALRHADRVLSLTLMSTSPVTTEKRELPAPTQDFNWFLENASVDWDDRQSVIDYIVGYDRMLAGGRRPFDEAARRELVSADFDRAHDYAAIQNHDVVAAEPGEPGPLGAMNAPTLVIHGTADPMFPIAHGEALAREIPTANLMRLQGAGHGLLPADWEPVATAILAHTAGA